VDVEIMCASVVKQDRDSKAYAPLVVPAGGSSPKKDVELEKVDGMAKALERLYTDNVLRSKILVAIPSFNEEVAIGSVVLRSLKFAGKVLVIDDGSTDKTAEIARLAGAEVLVHVKNMGKGAAIKSAFEYAKKNDAEILVLIDGDGQHNPDEIPLLISPIILEEADMVNGSRFLLKNGNSNKVPAYRRLGQEVLTLTTNMGTQQKMTDSQNGFRAFSKKTFDSFSFKHNGMAIESEMLIDAAHAGLMIKEVPINVRYDVDGSTHHPIRHGAGVLNSIIGLVSQRRPLLFFCVPGAIFFTVGLIFCIMVLQIFSATHTIAVGYTIFGVLCIVLGTFSIFTGLTLLSIQSIKHK
jgi:glycosyltransferase involved in cell wall biosynthesis